MDISSIRRKNLLVLIERYKTQAGFAEAVDTAHAYISQLKKGVSATGKVIAMGTEFARKIEEKIGLQYGWMYSSHDQPEAASLQVESPVKSYAQQSLHIPLPTDTTAASIPMRSIPVLTWVQAGNWTPICPITDAEITEWLPWYPHCGKNGFALIVSGESMLPKFEPDDRIYVNPDAQVTDLRTGDLVVVSCEGDTAATFKRLVIETDAKYLEPLNPRYNDGKRMTLDNGCRLVGKVVGMYRYM